MIFVDEVTVDVKAGDGGNGAVSFRKEKFVPHGGPWGGDGGRGGNVALEADSNLSTLLDFRYQSHYHGDRGGNGMGNNMIGKDAVDLVLKVPIGTIAVNVETGKTIADLTRHGQVEVIAKGGRGGRGNSHFKTSTNQAPKYAENGEPGEEFPVKLEIKLLADVGLVGFPNAGKSSLIAAVSAARPKIANYPFTTLTPNLGVVKISEAYGDSLVFADIPGIIEGASEGAGLGHQFLRHVERTRILIHVLDAGGMSGRDPVEDFEKLNHELKAYSDRLANLKQVVALNKIDIADPEKIEELHQHFVDAGYSVFPISAATGEGTKPLLYLIGDMIKSIPREIFHETEEDVRITAKDGAYSPFAERKRMRQYTVQRDPDTQDLIVRGKSLERLVAMTQLTNEQALHRFEKILEKVGVIRRLKDNGAKDGDTVKIGNFEFDFIDEDYRDEDEK
jgi:GTP-binding protein